METEFLKETWQRLINQSRAASAGIGIILVIAIGIADYITGYEFVLSILYLLPVSLFTWSLGRQAGIIMAVASVFMEVFADLVGGLPVSSPLVQIWNIIIKISIFIVYSIVLSAFKNSYDREKSLSRKDSLTGIANRHAFVESASREIERCRRYRHPMTVAYIDCDNFKAVNDALGHQAGDMLLRKVAVALQINLRTPDIVARIGGDEFVVMLPETGAEAADATFKKLQGILLDAMQKNKWPVTFSIGIATFSSPPASYEEMIKKADTLMYDIKSSGKNMIKHQIFDK